VGVLGSRFQRAAVIRAGPPSTGSLVRVDVVARPEAPRRARTSLAASFRVGLSQRRRVLVEDPSTHI